jgi:hypothetical protein
LDGALGSPAATFNFTSSTAGSPHVFFVIIVVLLIVGYLLETSIQHYFLLCFSHYLPCPVASCAFRTNGMIRILDSFSTQVATSQLRPVAYICDISCAIPTCHDTDDNSAE